MPIKHNNLPAKTIGYLIIIFLPELGICVTETPESPTQQPPAIEYTHTETNTWSGNMQTGLQYYQIGQFELAKQQFTEICRQARAAENHNALAAALSNLGNAEAALEQFAAAAQDYQSSATQARANGQPSLAVKAYSNAAIIQILQGNLESAYTAIGSADAQLQILPDNPEKAELALGLGHLLQIIGQQKTGDETVVKLAYQNLNSGIKLAEDLKQDSLRSYGYGYLGALYLHQNRFPEAMALTGQAEFLAQQLSRPDLLYRWQWQTARIFRRQNATAAAIGAYQAAIATLQPIRSSLHLTTLNNRLGDSIDTLYLETADTLLREQALPEAELLAARDMIEHGKIEELENYYHDDCVTSWLNKAAGIDRLANHTAALYPMMFTDRLELLLSLPGGLQRYTVYRRQADVRNLVEQLRVSLENRSSLEFLPYAQALYQLLIQPIQADLQKAEIDTLVFVPDASFRTIPLAALHNGQHFLISDYAIATSPGLTLTEPQAIQAENSKVLLAGLSEASQGFKALPQVKAEIQTIAEQFPATILADQAFKVATVKQQLQENPYQIVHIASHGQFDRNLNNTFVLAADGKISFDTLGKMLGVSRFRREPVELLTLSACQTAAGDEQAALGLAGLAMKAGVRSALASLWYVNDNASATIMAAFYQQLKNSSDSKAKSLQKAQLALLNNERYEHPAYWAPFLIIGNWL